MPNVLLEEIEYKIDETRSGTWRRYGYIDGTSYHEFTSRTRVFGMPLVHYTYGRNPETGRRRCARGIIAVGRFSFGVIAIGQICAGLVAVGQVAVGVIFGLGQLSTGATAIGQIAAGVMIGLGQVATGYVAVGQFAFGKYVLAQFGYGEFVWSVSRADWSAVEFFKNLPIIKDFLT
jgi:hypothetical protein